jgi:hypothetical protein
VCVEKPITARLASSRRSPTAAPDDDINFPPDNASIAAFCIALRGNHPDLMKRSISARSFGKHARRTRLERALGRPAGAARPITVPADKRPDRTLPTAESGRASKGATVHGTTNWVRPSLCESSSCFEVADGDDGQLLVRSSEGGPTLAFTVAEWQAFRAGMKGGDFDEIGTK